MITVKWGTMQYETKSYMEEKEDNDGWSAEEGRKQMEGDNGVTYGCFENDVRNDERFNGG